MAERKLSLKTPSGDFFKWWLAVGTRNSEDPLILSYEATTQAILCKGKIELLGEDRAGNLVHDVFNATVSSGTNPTALATIKRRRRELWPQRQVTDRSYRVTKFWFINQKTERKMLIDDLKLDVLNDLGLRGFINRQPGYRLYGKLDDKRWLNSDQHDHIINLVELTEGYYFAIGETSGRRQYYLLTAPATKDDVISYVAHPGISSSIRRRSRV